MLFRNSVKSYVITSTEEMFGRRLLLPEREQFVRGIAKQLEVGFDFKVRAMNASAMRMFGYANAFAYFPTLFSVFPIQVEPYIFISDTFFDELSEAEQRFLIGHELIHIKHGHLSLLPIFSRILALVIFALLWRVTRPFRYFSPDLFGGFGWECGIALSMLACLIGEGGLYLAVLKYRRMQEFEADTYSLRALTTYEGCLKFMDKLHRVYATPLEYSYALLQSHPSIKERKENCVVLRDNSERNA